MEDCIFCKIVKGEIPCQKVFEDEKILAFKDINPEAPVHILLIPKKHIEDMNSLQEEDAALISHIYLKAKMLAKEMEIDKSGYRFVTNCGDDGGQTVHHIHFHLLGGRKLHWPPG